MSIPFETMPVTVSQYPTSTVVDGRHVLGTPTLVEILASVQWVSGDEIVRSLPELDRTTRVIRVYTTTQIRTGSGSRPADRVAYDGASWEVIRVEHRPQLIPHYRAFAVRIEP